MADEKRELGNRCIICFRPAEYGATALYCFACWVVASRNYGRSGHQPSKNGK